MRVCYFISEYPAVSHTFIRREIAELERNDEGDITVFRVSLRKDIRNLVDQADRNEKERTKYILNESILSFVRALAAFVACRPKALFTAIRGTLKMMQRSNRPVVFHLAYLAEALVLARWLLEQGVSHIHAHFGANGAEVAMLSHFLTKIPYSFTVHGPGEFDRPEYLGLAEKVKHAAFVCAISSFTRSQIYRWIPAAEWRKIKLVRCGLDAEFLASRLPAKLSKTHFVSVGRLNEQKGQLVLLRALAALLREGVLFKMTIAGDGPLRPELERQIRELRLDGHVAITGWLSNSEIRALVLSARAVVLPSFAEGLPVALMEALALGRPVISTYVAGIPELVTDGVCGWLVPAGRADQLCSAMKDCLTAPDARIHAMGRAGRERVLEMHDIVRECRKLANLFRGNETGDWPITDAILAEESKGRGVAYAATPSDAAVLSPERSLAATAET